MSSLKFGSWRDWAAMSRLPNIPTVWSNVFTAWVLAGGDFIRPSTSFEFVMALLGATLLYVGGTIYNDVCDLAVDQTQRPERALPSGRVSSFVAQRVVAGLFAAGLLAFILGGGYVAVFLLAQIYIYDRHRHSHPLASALMMAACRLLLVVTVALMALGPDVWILPLKTRPLLCFWFAALFVYVVLLTWLAGKESRMTIRRLVGWMLAGLPVLDAIFLIVGGLPAMAIVAMICFLLAVLLRKIASAT